MGGRPGPVPFAARRRACEFTALSPKSTPNMTTTVRKYTEPVPASRPSRRIQVGTDFRRPAQGRSKYGKRVGLHRRQRDMSVDNPSENQRRIGAAKAERIRQDHIDIPLFRLMRHKVDRRFHRWIVQIERRRRDAVAHRQDTRRSPPPRRLRPADGRSTTWSRTSTCGPPRCRPGAAPRRVRSRRRAASRCHAR